MPASYSTHHAHQNPTSASPHAAPAAHPNRAHPPSLALAHTLGPPPYSRPLLRVPNRASTPAQARSPSPPHNHTPRKLYPPSRSPARMRVRRRSQLARRMHAPAPCSRWSVSSHSVHAHSTAHSARPHARPCRPRVHRDHALAVHVYSPSRSHARAASCIVARYIRTCIYPPLFFYYTFPRPCSTAHGPSTCMSNT